MSTQRRNSEKGKFIAENGSAFRVAIISPGGVGEPSG